MQKAVFLDRDGVINHDPGDYTKSVNEFTFLPEIFESLRQLNHAGFKLIVITNQGGIAREKYSLEDFRTIDRYMHQRFREEQISILQTFFCPHHDLLGNCLCRKPKSLLVERALAKYQLSAAQSFFIGDKPRDIQCAETAGVKGILIDTNDLLKKHLHLLLN